MEEQGLDVVLSPLQLSAVLEEESVDEASCLGNAFWGAASVLVGAVELAGAATLLLTPEPTTLTKIAGVALATHGADTASTGIVQIASCQTRTTVTSKGAAALARALGADENTAAHVGYAIEIAVPLAAGFVGIARVLSVSRGLLSLQAEEAAGGHTIARHVGKSEAELRMRLSRSTRMQAASTFATLKDAEYAVSMTLRANKDLIKAWARSAQAGERGVFTWTSRRLVGHGLLRQSGRLTTTSQVTVVLRKVTAQNRIYFLLTAYPSFK